MSKKTKSGNIPILPNGRRDDGSGLASPTIEQEGRRAYPPFWQIRGGHRSVWSLALLWIMAIDTAGLYLYLSHRIYLLSPVWIYLAIYFVLFAFYAYSGGCLVRRLDAGQTRHALFLIVLAAIVFRFIALPSSPSLSTDMYRYVWDGRLTTHGINPYRWAPYANFLRMYRDPIWNAMEYKSYQTIYMPMSQLVFALCNAVFKNNLIGYKLIFTLFDIGTICILLAILRSRGMNGTQIIWYAWCPLPITEVCIAGHQDVVGVFFLALTFWLVRRRRRAWIAAITLICAALTKGFALMLLPLFIRAYGRRFAVVAAITLVYLGLPLWVYLPQFSHGMEQYLDTVHVNSSLFYWTDSALAHITRYHFQIVAKLSDTAIIVAAVWSAWRRPAGYTDLLRRSFIVLAVILMVVGTLFPWYLLWVIPFLPLLGRRPSWALVALCCTIGLLYTYYISIRPLWWTPILEYVPFYAILIWEYADWRRRRRTGVGYSGRHIISYLRSRGRLPVDSATEPATSAPVD